MFIRSRFSGWLLYQGRVFSSLLFAFPECCSVFKVLRRGRRFRFPLTTGSGYHTFPGLSFNPWFDSFFPMEAGKEFRFPASTRKALAENAFRRSCKAIESIACLRPMPLLSGVPIPYRARFQPVDVRFDFPVSPVRTAGRGGRPLTCN